MSGKEINRAAYFKRLYDEMFAEADSKLDIKDRQKFAEKQMDKKLGKAWRSEIAKPELEMVEIVIETPTKKSSHEELESLYNRLRKEGDKEGLGHGPDAPDMHEVKDKEECIADRLAALEEKVSELINASK